MASASGSHKESDLDVKARRGKTIFTTLVFDKMAQCALLFETMYVAHAYTKIYYIGNS
jgi:hypothetical protein